MIRETDMNQVSRFIHLRHQALSIGKLHAKNKHMQTSKPGQLQPYLPERTHPTPAEKLGDCVQAKLLSLGSKMPTQPMIDQSKDR